jgi:hypothetical protein
MIDHSCYDFCSEFYTVEKSVEVVVEISGEAETIRIDAYKQGKSGGYCTRSFIQCDVTVQPTYPQENGNFVKKPESITVWATYDLPWADQGSADAAIVQTLGFLKKHCSR